jgi:hypothetical protein
LRILLTPATRANFDAQFYLVSRPQEVYRISQMDPRFDAFGTLDHYQCDLELN